jgi:hypothetical protein
MEAAMTADIIPLADIEGGTSGDGERILLILQDQSGTQHQFSLPHESAGEVIWKVQALANEAQQKRQNIHSHSAKVEIASTRAFQADQVHLQPFDQKNAVLLLRIGSVHAAFHLDRSRLSEMQKGLSGCQEILDPPPSGALH